MKTIITKVINNRVVKFLEVLPVHVQQTLDSVLPNYPDAFVYDGSYRPDLWVDGQLVTIVPLLNLDDLKVIKNSEINAARLTANQTTFTHGGKVFACDPLSRSDIDGINGYVGTRNDLPAGWVGGWKAFDNSVLPIANVTAWNAFYDSMIAQGQANFAHSQALKTQLAAATTAEEVAAITW